MKHPRFLYFAECVGPNGSLMGAVKVGCTSNVQVRLTRVKQCQPYEVRLIGSCPGGFFEEAAVHWWLAGDCIRGEFFHDRGETRRLADLVASTGKMPLPIEPPLDPFTSIPPHGAAHFMAKHGLSLKDVARLAGGRLVAWEAAAKQARAPKQFIAALTVAAIRKGNAVDWQFDFLAFPDDMAKAA